MTIRQYRTTVDARTVAILLGNAITDTTLTLNSPSVNTLPTTYPYTLVIDPDTASEEIVTVTSGASNILTIVRNRDNTTIKSHAVGAAVRHMVTARDLQEPQEHMHATGRYLDTIDNTYYEPHGLGSTDGTFVGTTKTQSLTNKTLNAGTLTGTTTNSGTISGGQIASTTIQSPTLTGTTDVSGTTLSLGTTGLITTNGVTVSAVELGYLDNVTSSIQNQLNTKAPIASPTFTGTVTIPTGSSITNPTIAAGTLTGTITNSGTINGGTVSATTISVPFGGTISVSAGGTFALGGAGNITANGAIIGADEVAYLDGVTSSIQTQLNTSTSAWTTYTPTLGGTSAALGNGSVANSAYKQIGKTVHFRITLVLGSTTNVSTTGLTLSLPPFTPISNAVGQCIATDNSASDRFAGEVLITTSGTAIPLATPATAGTRSRNIETAVPFTWTTLDSLVISGTYEAA